MNDEARPAPCERFSYGSANALGRTCDEDGFSVKFHKQHANEIKAWGQAKENGYPMNQTTPSNRSIWSWASYDFANTIFSAVVLTAYFPLYLTELAGANWYLGVATTASMVLAGLAVPLFGVLSDQTGKTKKYLFRTTAAAVFFCAVLSLTKKPSLLIFIFLIACFFYHASLVFYNSLLPVVSPPNQQGRVSGLGTGLGYLGVVLTLPIAHWVDQTLGRPYVFVAAAVLFLLFSLPLFFFVPERTADHPIPFRWNLLRSEWKKLLGTMKGLPSRPAMLLFLAGNFFVVDALNSAIFWLVVYARETFQAEQSQLILFLMGTNFCAFGAGLILGWVTDRWGAMRTLILSSALLVLTLFLLGSAQSFLLFSLFCFTGGASAIAGIWTSGRKALIEFAPKDKIGEYFGLYGLTTKVSVIGSLIFSIVADVAGFRQAIWVLMFPAAIGMICLIFSNVLKKSRA